MAENHIPQNHGKKLIPSYVRPPGKAASSMLRRFFVQVMPHRQNRMAVNHSRARISHHRPDSFAQLRRITMDRTLRTFRFDLFERTLFQAFFHLIQKIAALPTKSVFSAVMITAENFNHSRSGFNFLFHGS
jgi:hypothetical protein